MATLMTEMDASQTLYDGVSSSRPSSFTARHIKTLKTNGASIFIYLFIHLNRIIPHSSQA